MKNIIQNKHFKLTVLIILAVVLAFGYKSIQAQNTQTAKFNSRTDQIVTPSRRDLTSYLTLAGSLDALNRSDVRFQTSGLLTWVGVKVGDKVNKWQAIASLDRRELEKRLQQEFNDYRTALHNFQDTQDKYKTEKENLILTDEMKRILDRSQFTLNNAVIAYELADLARRFATISSPIAGIVVNIDQPVAGVNVTPATSTFTVVDPASIYFKSNVDEEEVQNIHLGQEAQITLDSYPDQPISSKVTYISFTPVTGETSTVYEVRYDLAGLGANTDLKYRLGMSGDADIVKGSASGVMTIPIDALLEENDKTYVWVKGDRDILTKKEIKTGLETDTDIEVQEGLLESDQIVIRGR